MRLRRRFLCCLGLFFGVVSPGAAQPEPAPPADSKAQREVTSLAALIEAYEKGEVELARAREELEAAEDPSQAGRIKEAIRKREVQQDRLFESIEKIVGPLPPKVAQEQPTSLERQLESQEQRHETILESDVEKRLR